MESYKLTLGIREALAQQEVELQKQMLVDAHLAKINRITNEKLDFKLEKVVRRQNSFDPDLPIFGLGQDTMNQEILLKR
jgi:hypothetical protein